MVLSLVGPQTPSPPWVTASAEGAATSMAVTTQAARRTIRLRLIARKATGCGGDPYRFQRRDQDGVVRGGRPLAGHGRHLQVPHRSLEDGCPQGCGQLLLLERGY